MDNLTSDPDRYLELYDQFLNGDINKHAYIREMHNLHRSLFVYQSLVRKSEISSVEINSDRIIATVRDRHIKFYLDEYDSRFIPIEIINFGAFEPLEKNILDYMASQSRFIVDIGANIGWYTMRFSKIRSVERVFAFEAIPRTFSLLSEHISLNELENVTLVNKALLDQEKKVIFNWSREETGSASLINIQDRVEINQSEVEATTFDKYFFSKKIPVDFIKCDVEGSELFVMRGASNYLKHYSPFIFCELLRKWSAKFGYHPNEVIDFLGKYGYQCFAVHNSRLVELTEITEATDQTNFIFLHRENHRETLKEFSPIPA